MNIEAAMKLRTAKDLLRAAQAAETHNCELTVVNTLWARYYEVLERETLAAVRKEPQPLNPR